MRSDRLLTILLSVQKLRSGAWNCSRLVVDHELVGIAALISTTSAPPSKISPLSMCSLLLNYFSTSVEFDDSIRLATGVIAPVSFACTKKFVVQGIG